MIDIISVSENCNIISGLIQKHSVFSLNKILFYTFYLSIGEHVVITNNKKNGVEKDFFELIGVNLLNNQDKIKNIFIALNLLETSNAIQLYNNCYIEEKKLSYTFKNKILESKIFKKIINKTKDLSDETFMLEVIKNV